MKTLPIVADIINDLEIIDGEVLLSAERLEHWAKVLRRDYWGPEHRDVYLQLGGFTIELAEKRYLAAIQFEALATLPSCAANMAKAKSASKFSKSACKQQMFNKLMGTRKIENPTFSAPTLKASSFMTPSIARPRPQPMNVAAAPGGTRLTATTRARAARRLR